jgi:transcriptional regulator with XRE-family HTH domain
MSEDEFYQWLGNYIQSLRREKKKTQQELCQMVSLSRSSLSNIETGRHRLSFFDLYQLMQVLDEPMAKLIDSLLAMNRQESL